MELNYLNYKEPLTPVEDGFGYKGTLAQTTNRELVQCHIDGHLVENLGSYVWAKYKIKSSEYREMFGLGKRTPLCSDVYSEKRSREFFERWNRLTPEEQEQRRTALAEARTNTQRVGNPTSLEIQNKRGMCPDQLIEKIELLANKLGQSPSFDQFKSEYDGKYVGAIFRTFGSWNGAKRVAGFPPLRSGSKVPHNRSPYTNDQLLEFLRSFKSEHKRIPTYSDWRKGFLPSYHLYKHRFGGIAKARELAGIAE